MAISAAQAAGDATALAATLIAALASLRMSRGHQDVQTAVDIIQKFEQAKLAGNAASARLSTAEALAAAGNNDLARSMALEALEFCDPRGVWESAWRGHTVAARASKDISEVQAHRNAALSAFARLRKLWAAGDVDSYLHRADITQLSGSMRF
jgi:hypothetical protein